MNRRNLHLMHSLLSVAMLAFVCKALAGPAAPMFSVLFTGLLVTAFTMAALNVILELTAPQFTVYPPRYSLFHRERPLFGLNFDFSFAPRRYFDDYVAQPYGAWRRRHNPVYQVPPTAPPTAHHDHHQHRQHRQHRQRVVPVNQQPAPAPADPSVSGPQLVGRLYVPASGQTQQQQQQQQQQTAPRPARVSFAVSGTETHRADPAVAGPQQVSSRVVKAPGTQAADPVVVADPNKAGPQHVGSRVVKAPEATVPRQPAAQPRSQGGMLAAFLQQRRDTPARPTRPAPSAPPHQSGSSARRGPPPAGQAPRYTPLVGGGSQGTARPAGGQQPTPGGGPVKVASRVVKKS